MKMTKMIEEQAKVVLVVGKILNKRIRESARKRVLENDLLRAQLDEEARVTDNEVTAIVASVTALAGRVAMNEQIDDAQDAELTALTDRIEGVEARALVPGPKGDKGPAGPAGPAGTPGRNGSVVYVGGGSSSAGGTTEVLAGTGIQTSGTTTQVTVTNTGVTNLTGIGVSLSASTGDVTITAPTVSAGTGINVSGSQTTSLTVTNAGVTSIVAGTGVTVSASTGAVTVNASASTTFDAPGSSAVADTVSAGSSTSAARADHRHGRESFATPGSSAIGDAAASGSASTLARSDHVHGREAFANPVASAPGDTMAPGVASTVARSDHKHAREALGVTSIVAGTNVTVSDATGAVTVNAPAFATPGSSAIGDAAASGSASTIARSDHVHGREAFGTPVVVNAQTTALATGSLTTVARSDHVHTVSGVPVLLGTVTLAATASSITFSSIPQTSKHLIIYGAWASNRAGQVGDTAGLRFNGEAGLHYYSSSGSLQSFGDIGNPMGATAMGGNVGFAHINVFIPAYTTTSRKQSVGIGAGATNTTFGQTVNTYSGIFNKTDAITSVQVVVFYGLFTVGTSLQLWGYG